MAAVFWMTGTMISFCLMAVAGRELNGNLSVYQILFFRSAIGLLCVSIIALFSKGRTSVRTKRILSHGLRNIFHFAGQYGWFLGIGLLPLAEVFSLEFTVPIWTLLMATLALNETITPRKLIAMALGMIGVLVIVQPGYAIVNPASFIVLGAAFCYAISHTITKSLSNSESAFSILCYMILVQLPISLVFALPDWSWPAGRQWLWLSLVGLTALSAHYCIAKAMVFAEVSTVVTMDFLRLPLIAMVGVFLYQEKFEMSLMVGGLLMLAGNFVSLKQTKNTAPKSGVIKVDHACITATNGR